VGTECSIAMVDAIIETLTGGDPSPPTTPPMLPNPIHTIDTVVEDGINKQPRVEVVHNVEQNVSHDNTVSKPAGILEDPGLSVAAPTTPHSPMGVPLDHIGVGLNVMEMLRSMSNNETLKELMEMSMQLAQLCHE
jgi:hypothetical protein